MEMRSLLGGPYVRSTDMSAGDDFVGTGEAVAVDGDVGDTVVAVE